MLSTSGRLGWAGSTCPAGRGPENRPMPSAAAPSQPIRLLPRLTGAQAQKVTYTRKTHADEIKTTCWGRGRKVDVIYLLFTWCGKYTNTVVTQMHRSDTTHMGCRHWLVWGRWMRHCPRPVGGLGWGAAAHTSRGKPPAVSPAPATSPSACRTASCASVCPPTPGIPGPAPVLWDLGQEGHGPVHLKG